MRTFLRVVGAAVALVLLAAGSFYFWASSASARELGRSVETHAVDFPVPFPLDADERMELDIADEATAADIAMERAVARGRHLVEARYGCADCHGEDFGGGVMVDAFPIGSLLGPNLTSGEGSRTRGYTAADWDRIVRHGVDQDGTASAMPSQDFQLMSDRELSDIIAYIRSLPPVDNQVPPVRLGPLGKVLVATGGIPLSVDLIPSHTTPHAVEPPTAAPTLEFGRHLAGTCTGCHGSDFAGGPVPGGDPSWPPAANLTPHATALGSWSYEDFRTTMLEGARPDGSGLRVPMSDLTVYAQNMTDVEMEALWLYLRSIPEISAEE